MVRVVMLPSPIPSTTDLQREERVISGLVLLPRQWLEMPSVKHFSDRQPEPVQAAVRGVVKSLNSTHLPSAVVSIPLRSAWTLKLAIIIPSFRRKALMVFLPLW